MADQQGLTLIEILVVIVILGIMASLVGPAVFGHVGTAKTTTARSQIELLSAALDAYRLDTGMYPTTEQGLASLREEPARPPLVRGWRGPYLRRDVPLDPWGHPYLYRSPGDENSIGFDLLSYGLDGEPGGEGENADVTSWE
jgi:general secretion pathway protein G